MAVARLIAIKLLMTFAPIFLAAFSLWFQEGFILRSIRRNVTLLSGLSLGLLSAVSAQNSSQPSAVAPKYRTHFVIHDVQKKTSTTIFTIEGEWHAPNWTPDGKYIVSDMGGDIYRIPVSGANSGSPLATHEKSLAHWTSSKSTSFAPKPMVTSFVSGCDLRKPITKSSCVESYPTCSGTSERSTRCQERCREEACCGFPRASRVYGFQAETLTNVAGEANEVVRIQIRKSGFAMLDGLIRAGAWEGAGLGR